jgi:hypothetical protein
VRSASYDTPSYVYGLATGDFNRDGRLDVVGAGFQNFVFIWLGDADGTLRSPALFEIRSAAFPRAVVVGDFNADGRLDVALPLTILHILRRDLGRDPLQPCRASASHRSPRSPTS